MRKHLLALCVLAVATAAPAHALRIVPGQTLQVAFVASANGAPAPYDGVIIDVGLGPAHDPSLNGEIIFEFFSIDETLLTTFVVGNGPITSVNFRLTHPLPTPAGTLLVSSQDDVLDLTVTRLRMQNVTVDPGNFTADAMLTHTVIPEPTSRMLLGLGLAACAALRRGPFPRKQVRAG